MELSDQIEGFLENGFFFFFFFFNNFFFLNLNFVEQKKNKLKHLSDFLVSLAHQFMISKKPDTQEKHLSRLWSLFSAIKNPDQVFSFFFSFLLPSSHSPPPLFFFLDEL